MSLSASITVKNYRCFSESEPLRINIEEGFTAIVGKNNSGKSSILRFFYEFRGLWNSISSEYAINQGLNTSHIFAHDSDPEALFFFDNDRDLEIDLAFDMHANNALSVEKEALVHRLKIVFSRAKPRNINLFLYAGEDIINALDLTYGVVSKGGSGLLFNQVHIKFNHAVVFFNNLKDACYIGPFRNAVNAGNGHQYYDLSVGESFVQQWNQWKNGGRVAESRVISQVTKDIRAIFEFESLDINASSDNKTLKININDNPYGLEELGAGLAEFIIVLGSVAIKKPTLILIDEPELHLHPTLQIDFLTTLAKYSTHGVMFATHALGLARSVADQIYVSQLNKGCSKVTKLDDTPNYIEFLGEMSFSAYKALGYESILLVEGVTDVKVVQQFLRRLKKEHKVVILPLGGNQLAKGGVESELSEFQRLSDSVYALVDSEREAEGAAPKRERTEFKKTCDGLGFQVHLTEKRAMDNYFTEQAVKEEKGDSFSALEPYELLKNANNPWAKRDGWRIAGRMTKEEILKTDIGNFLSKIK